MPHHPISQPCPHPRRPPCSTAGAPATDAVSAAAALRVPAADVAGRPGLGRGRSRLDAVRVLALDLGTSSVRGMVLDAAARPLPGALARRKVIVDVDPAGAATLDAAGYLAAWWHAWTSCQPPATSTASALVAASAQWHSVLPLDAARRARSGPC